MISPPKGDLKLRVIYLYLHHIPNLGLAHQHLGRKGGKRLSAPFWPFRSTTHPQAKFSVRCTCTMHKSGVRAMISRQGLGLSPGSSPSTSPLQTSFTHSLPTRSPLLPPQSCSTIENFLFALLFFFFLSRLPFFSPFLFSSFSFCADAFQPGFGNMVERERLWTIFFFVLFSLKHLYFLLSALFLFF